MFFRPEEIHGTSGIRDILQPLGDGNRNVADEFRHIGGYNYAIRYLQPNGFAAIQTDRIHLNRFTRKQPADRQRFKGSLAEPLLPAIDCYPVLGRQVVKRRKRGYIIGVWEQPAGDS